MESVRVGVKPPGRVCNSKSALPMPTERSAMMSCVAGPSPPGFLTLSILVGLLVKAVGKRKGEG